MRLVYFDEVKYHETNQPYYWLGGIVVTPKAIWRLENELSILSEDIFGVRTLSRETEFHAADIFHRKRNFKHWNKIDERLKVLNRLADIFSSEKELAKVIVRIDPSKIKYPTDIEGKAFMFFVEKVEQYLRANTPPGMLIGDRENERVSKQFSETLSEYRATGTLHQFGMELTHLIDTVHFTDSHHSRLLQLADLFVWTSQLCRNSSSDSFPHKVFTEHVRENTTLLNPDKYKVWPTDMSWYQ